MISPPTSAKPRVSYYFTCRLKISLPLPLLQHTTPSNPSYRAYLISIANTEAHRSEFFIESPAYNWVRGRGKYIALLYLLLWILDLIRLGRWRERFVSRRYRIWFLFWCVWGMGYGVLGMFSARFWRGQGWWVGCAWLILLFREREREMERLLRKFRWDLYTLENQADPLVFSAFPCVLVNIAPFVPYIKTKHCISHLIGLKIRPPLHPTFFSSA